MTFDPKRSLVMASFKTVLGHNLPAGTPLSIVEEPSARAEVDEALARRMFAGGIAAYAEDHRPTPVETPDQEKARLAAEALRDARGGDLVPLDDLTVWQADDDETGKKKGAKVTKDDLLVIAAREGVVIETDDNKADLTRKIMERRAATLNNSLTNAGSTGSVDQGGTGAQGSGSPDGANGADGGADGDAHGKAGEGQSDEAE